jgi:hypothetical protein
MSNIDLEFYAEVKEGKIIYPSYVLPWLDKREDVHAILKSVKNKVSSKQIALYFGWDIPHIITWLKETQGEDQTKETVHLYHIQHVMRTKFTTKTFNGKTIIIFEDAGISKMSTIEFGMFRETYIRYWALKSCEIPDPPEKLKDYDIFKG